MNLPNQRLVLCDVATASVSWLYLVFAYLVVEYGSPYVPICPTRLFTGLACPLCGSTRLIGKYLHGDFATGLEHLPGLGWFLLVCYSGVASSVRLLAHKNWLTIQETTRVDEGLGEKISSDWGLG